MELLFLICVASALIGGLIRRLRHPPFPLTKQEQTPINTDDSYFDLWAIRLDRWFKFAAAGTPPLSATYGWKRRSKHR